MTIVPSNKISEPKYKVSPPSWVFMIIWSVLVIMFVGVINLPIENTILRVVVIGSGCLAAIGIISKQLKGNYLVTMQANRAGLYFQTDNFNQYYLVPWENTGVIEKTIFPSNSRGLKIEVVGEYSEKVKGTDCIGNVITENGRTFVYTLPQLQNRDKLIKTLLDLKDKSL